jgi:alpha-L-fucosidase
MTMNDSWGFHKTDTNWKTSRTMIRMLIETSSKGGNFLLNVGPRADGTFPPEIVERLEDIGDWMKLHSEAIYGTQASPFKKLPWGRATARPGRLYLHVFDWPADGKLRVPGLRAEVRGAWLVTDPAFPHLAFERAGDDLVVSVPAVMPNQDATVIALDIAGETTVVATRITPGNDGILVLRARDADVHGHGARYEEGNGKDNIGYWMDPKDTVSWEASVPTAGRYSVSIEYACDAGSAGSEFRLLVAGQALKGKVASTGSWTAFKSVSIGDVEVAPGGHVTVRVEPTSKPGLAVMNLKSVRLTPSAN